MALKRQDMNAGRTLVLGIGLREAAQTADLLDLWLAAKTQLPFEVTAGTAVWIAVLQRKTTHPALQAFHQKHLPKATLISYSDEQLQGIATPTQSAHSVQRFGCGSVCEALALVEITKTRPPSFMPTSTQVGAQGGQLLLSRQITSNRLATLAIAQHNHARNRL